VHFPEIHFHPIRLVIILVSMSEALNLTGARKETEKLRTEIERHIRLF